MPTAQFRLGGSRFTRMYLDPVSAKDAVVLQRQYLGGAQLTADASETVSLAEAVATVARHYAAPSENVTLAEGVIALEHAHVALSDAAFALTESVAAAKAARAVVGENAVLSEQLVASQHLAIGVGEAVTLAEALGAAAHRLALVGENMSLIESVASARVANVVVGEGLALGEQLAAATSSTIALAEAVALAEAASSAYVAGVELAETVPAWGELVGAVAGHVVAVGEAIALAEQLAAHSAWRAQVGEVVALAEQVIGDQTMIVWVDETMSLSESLQTVYTPIDGPIMPISIPLPAPSSNAPGPWVDVSSMGPQKTITVTGDCRGSINFEITNALVPLGGCPIVTIARRGSANILCAARWMRARVSGYRGGGAPVVAVGADDTGATFANLPVTARDGTGPDADVSTMGLFKTICVSGRFRGTVLIEIGDGTSWSQVLVFTAPGARSMTLGTLRMRATRNGVPQIAPGTPQVDIAGATVYR